MPWLRFAEAQEKYKISRDMLQAAQKNLTDVKAEVAQSAGPLKCVVAVRQHRGFRAVGLGYEAVTSRNFHVQLLARDNPSPKSRSRGLSIWAE